MDNEAVLRQFLKERFSGFEEGLGAEAPLDGVVDSLAMFDLVEFVEQQFSVSIPNESFSPRSFATIRDILELVEQFQAP